MIPLYSILLKVIPCEKPITSVFLFDFLLIKLQYDLTKGDATCLPFISLIIEFKKRRYSLPDMSTSSMKQSVLVSNSSFVVLQKNLDERITYKNKVCFLTRCTTGRLNFYVEYSSLLEYWIFYWRNVNKRPAHNVINRGLLEFCYGQYCTNDLSGVYT